MPCRSGYDDEPQIVYREKKVYIGNSELKKELDEVRRTVEDYVDRANKAIRERNAMKAELDEMTRAFCYMTNRLFDYDEEYLRLILEKDHEVHKVFAEHQQLDKKAGRSFLYKGKNGKLVRVEGDD